MKYLAVSLLVILVSVPAARSGAQPTDALLGPERAFEVTAQPEEGRLRLHWRVANGYYLYRDRFRFAAEPGRLEIGSAFIPAGLMKNDRLFGEVQILRGAFTMSLPYKVLEGRDRRLELRVTSQGCADIGFCYPPHTQAIEWDAPTGAPPRRADRPAALTLVAQLADVLGLSGESEFLPADLAFVLSARIRDDGKVIARWDIADGYYLYRDKFKASLSDSPGFELVQGTLPPGILKRDEYFGDVEVFYGEVEYELEVNRVGDGFRTLNLDLGYQGCADAGLCYAPIVARLPLDAPAVAARGQAAP